MSRIRASRSAATVSVGIVASLGTAGWAQAPMDTEAESKQVKAVMEKRDGSWLIVETSYQ